MNEKEKFEKDARTLCKYGSHCYQKNKAHHDKYKHPPDTSSTAKEQIPNTKPTGETTTLKQQKLNFFIKKKEIKAEVAKNEEGPVESKADIKTKVAEEDSEENEERIEKESSSVVISKEDTCADISEEDGKKIIKKLFLVDMPTDFYSFWSFCKSLSPENPKDVLNDIDLTLVGPFDVLANSLKEDSVSDSEALRHWRYYYDPPEFQTIMKSSKDLFHLGYFRDDPNLPPVFVAYNAAAKNSLISHVAENIFGAVDWHMTQCEKASNPFKKMKSSNLRSALHEWAKKHDFTLEKYSKKMQERNKLTVCKTFHQAGIIVPYDEKTQLGYRPLAETPSNLKKLLKKIETAQTTEERTAHFNALYSVVNWANIAMDEGDFGTSLELGLDLFSYGTDHFNSIILASLENAYNLLGRQAFASIIKAHLEDRKKGDDLSVIKTK